jgi:glyoxylase-like metal-dependent hydrolase (beta-lactamase superfamily II)
MANDRESELHYPLGEALPALGATLDVAPGVRWVRMTLPFALDHVNLWLLRDRDDADGTEGWALVDCGITADATKAAWEQVFAESLDGLPVLRVIATHMHPDHVGLAHWLTRRWSVDGRECRLWMSATDWNGARLASAGGMVSGPNAAEFFASHGMTDPASLEKVRGRTSYYSDLVPEVPRRFRRLLDGQRIAVGPSGARHDWTCIAGYGHSPEHMSLHCPELGLLISGDMVLPRISTNVSVMDFEPEADPLALYLASIEKLRALPADTLVLPSHGKPFTGLHRRVQQLVDHHELRFAEVLAACATAPRTAAEVLPVLFKRALDLHQTTFAMGETIAHLNALWMDGRLRREVGSDGTIRFATP